VRYGANSRVDFLLTAEDRPPCWLEIKNCHLRRTGTLAEFPDCVAARSLKHLRELSAMVAAGERAVMLFVIQRTDCDAFEACADLDPAYARGLAQAAADGVEVLAYRCAITPERVTLADRVPWLGAAPA
jgi:sugar fermentation stimulation protein A